METLLSIAIGLGLSAACGFRVFVPLLFLSLASRTGHLTLSPEFQWIGSIPALMTLSTATVLEVLAYYVPWFDHLMDMMATPTAMVAGVVATASVVSDFSPLLKWSVAVVGGGGMAGVIQGTTVLARFKSTALTGGLGNPLFSSLELAGAVLTSSLAIFLPLLCLFVLILFLGIVFLASRHIFFGRRASYVVSQNRLL